MVFSRSAGVGRHDLTPQNSALFLRVKSDARLGRTRKSLFLDGHYLIYQLPNHAWSGLWNCTPYQELRDLILLWKLFHTTLTKSFHNLLNRFLILLSIKLKSCEKLSEIISGTFLAQMNSGGRGKMDSLEIMGVVCAVTALVHALVNWNLIELNCNGAIF